LYQRVRCHTINELPRKIAQLNPQPCQQRQLPAESQQVRLIRPRVYEKNTEH
jgi:hypothetical protein